MSRIRPVLGYTGAALTLLAALLTPFLLYGWFQNVIGGAGLRIHPIYSGGEVSHVLKRGGYSILVNRPVLRHTPLERFDSFVQIAWTPASGLPERVADEVDLDGDGNPDVLVQFDVPKDPSLDLVADVTPRGGHVRPLHAKGAASLFALIARVKDTIVVRVPVKTP